ncbi:hypothetical protein [Marinobacter sp. JSM 1782161]|uniref:hypothetical protein n=1 Tax=Marinobacter sp. JSM 1782161 TaxID=2685906 RepID=UPI001402163B|nr:hypothetical protein [Marinobacter sp. JSM 1782161]
MGGIDVDIVRRTPDAKPVKICASACGTGSGLGHSWRQIDRNEALVGCLFSNGVYVVLYDNEFRVVSRDTNELPPQITPT